MLDLMMKYQYIVYVSVAVKPLMSIEIDQLLISSREFNETHGVTGVLLCHKNTFFQFFEGSPADVAEVYERIKNSSQHTSILELCNEFSSKRYFNSWSMGFCYMPQTQIQALLDAEWKNQLPMVKMHAEESFGLKLLQEFWNKLATKLAA
jgi:hypothetical protein